SWRRHWNEARDKAGQGNKVILALDEIQKVPQWTSEVKRLWEEDSYAGRDIRLVLLGSSALQIQKHLSESLLGRFEIIWFPHWSFLECHEAFGWSVEDYLFFGGYPGGEPLIHDEERWRNFIMNSMIEPVLSQDIMLLAAVQKPALLRKLLFLSCEYAAQVLSYTKIIGQFNDVSNTVTIASYQRLLEQAFVIAGLQKWSGAAVQRRNSSPKWLPLNTALITAIQNKSKDALRQDKAFWGRLVEASVGAHLFNQAMIHSFEVYYWRDGNHEVDYVIRKGGRVTGIEVKTGFEYNTRSFEIFQQRYPKARTLIVGENGTGLEEFLMTPVLTYLQ
ncbi:MAG: DUF4143 domain-containing protein, partial [Candidatus Omnitrophica bacterium]|nr:DUF4143 domain-containing protein [Candidatus Omnitrophota bacterium]